MGRATNERLLRWAWHDPRPWCAAIAAMLCGLAGIAWVVAERVPLVPLRPFCVTATYDRQPIDGHLSEVTTYLAALALLGSQRPVRILGDPSPRASARTVLVTLSDRYLDRDLAVLAVMDWATSLTHDLPAIPGGIDLDLEAQVSAIYGKTSAPPIAERLAETADALARAKAGTRPRGFLTRLTCDRFPRAALAGESRPGTGIN